MDQKRFLVAVLLFIAGAFGSANAQTPYCIGSQTPVTVGYATGSIAINYQLCFPSLGNTSSFYWNSTMTYTNVSFDGSFSINGSMNMQLNFSNSAINSVVFNGGPLTYTIGGQTYTVSFNNLSYTLNSSFQVGSPTGLLTINGVTYAADTAYFAYLFR
jgi:hypothetical protein